MAWQQHTMTCATAAELMGGEVHPDCTAILCAAEGEEGYADGTIVWASHASASTPAVLRENPSVESFDWLPTE